MYNKFHKEQHLPQIKAPYEKIVDEFNDNHIQHKRISIDPNKLIPKHNIILGNNVSLHGSNERVEPIYIDESNNIIDGHYAVANALANDKTKIKAIKIGLPYDQAVRVLNKFQDINDYENQRQLEEVVARDYLNDENDINSDVSYNEFLTTLENETKNISEGNAQTLTGYRSSPVNEKSNVGNFFLLKPEKGYFKYEIDFENLFDASEYNKKNDSAIKGLVDLWFPHIDFNTLSHKYNVSSVNLMNRAITEKAMSLGYDGIKYNDKLLQGLK